MTCPCAFRPRTLAQNVSKCACGSSEGVDFYQRAVACFLSYMNMICPFCVAGVARHFRDILRSGALFYVAGAGHREGFIRVVLKRRQIKIGGGFGGPFSRQMQNLEDFSKGGQLRVVKLSSFLIWDMMINSVWHRVPRIHFCGRRSRPRPKVPETQVNSIVFDIFNAHVSWCAQFW